MAREKVVLFQKTGGDFIDPFDTGSFIRYKASVRIQKGETSGKDYLTTDFDMSLGDCNRVINWDFEKYDDDDDDYDFKMDKIDNALKILNEAKAVLVRAQKIATKERQRIEKDKEKESGNKNN